MKFFALITYLLDAYPGFSTLVLLVLGFIIGRFWL